MIARHTLNFLLEASQLSRHFHPTERIIKAAVKLEDGTIFAGSSHFMAMSAAINSGLLPELEFMNFDDYKKLCDEGFLTNAGRFVGREEAYQIATANQADELAKHGQQYSPCPADADRKWLDSDDLSI